METGIFLGQNICLDDFQKNDKLELKTKNGIVKIQVYQTDITQEKTNAIVNPANKQLILGGGVAGAIYKKCGNQIQEDCYEIIKNKKNKKVNTGNAEITNAYNLNCKYVIHAVGPVWRGGQKNEKEKLQNAILNSLKLADQNNLQSISFPAISSGIFNFPKELCAEIFFKTIISYFYQTDIISSLKLVRLTNFDYSTNKIFLDQLILIKKQLNQ